MNDIGSLLVRNAEIADLAALMDLHRTLKLGIIAKLAAPLITLYFRNIIQRRLFLFRVATDDKGVAGYAVVNTDLRVPRSAPFRATSVRTLGLLTRHPRSAWIIARYLLSRWRQSETCTHARNRFQWELYYIGVRPGSQRRGIGTMLLGDIGAQMRATGASHLGLEVFVEETNAVSFYRRLNSEPLGDVRTGDLVSHIMRIDEKDLPRQPVGVSH